jgi:hypothetical protein
MGISGKALQRSWRKLYNGTGPGGKKVVAVKKAKK